MKDLDIGEFNLCGDKRGVKFHDRNADGSRDADGVDNTPGNADDEVGLPGWTINLYTDPENNDVVEAGQAALETTLTGSDGTYEFAELQNGDYIVCEIKQDGWFQSRPVAGQSLPSGETLATCPGNTTGYAFTMAGADQTGNEFGNFQQGTKSGKKYNDLNANGTRDAGEPGLSGWEIRAYADANGNGVVDAGETFVSTTTDASGDYSFSLNPGRYVVCEVLQATWTQSEPAGPDECAAVPGLGADGYAITVTSGSSDPGNEFGNFQQGTKSGKKYNDLNANGTRDAGEPGLSGWEIRAYADANGNGVVDAGETFVSTTTDASGDYSFSLNPGRYVVCEVLQATWTQSEPAGPDECAAVPGLGADGYAITVTSGSSDPGNEFGNFQQGTKSGKKYNDLNANGTRDAGEPGLSGWEIRAYADANGNGVVDAGETFVSRRRMPAGTTRSR